MTNLPTKPKYEIAARAAKTHFLQVADEKTWTREVSFAMQALTTGQAAASLQKCTPDSIQNAVENIAMTGATLNPVMQQAFLIPRGSKACLDFSYRGLIKLAVDSGSILDMDACCVYENDEFSYEMGLTPVLRHVPTLNADKGVFTHVYAVAVLLSGIKKFIVLDKAEVDLIRKLAQYDAVWAKFYPEMARKTAIKKLYKMLPQSDKMSHAIMVLNEHEGLRERVDTGANLMRKLSGATEADPIDVGVKLGPEESGADDITDAEVSQDKAEEPTAVEPSDSDQTPNAPDGDLLTKDQLTRIQILFKEKGIMKQAERHLFCTNILKREVLSTSKLLWQEADEVKKALELVGQSRSSTE